MWVELHVSPRGVVGLRLFYWPLCLTLREHCVCLCDGDLGWITFRELPAFRFKTTFCRYKITTACRCRLCTGRKVQAEAEVQGRIAALGLKRRVLPVLTDL